MSLGHRAPATSPTKMRVSISTTIWAYPSGGQTEFSEAGIETVADLVGHTEEDLLRIEGIGVKAIEELKEGLEQHNLLARHRGRPRCNERRHDASCSIWCSRPDDTILIGGDEPPTFNTEGEDMLGEALPPRSYQRNLEELDALLGSVGSIGFGFSNSEDDDALGDESGSDEERISSVRGRHRAPPSSKGAFHG